MGMVLGLLGGGGSILTVPIMVYLFLIPASLATTYSLFIVGVSAIIGVIRYQKKKMIEFKIAAVFAIPAFISIYVVRRMILPIIPNSMTFFDLFSFTKDNLIMMIFSIVMLGASYSMIKGRNDNENLKVQNIPLLIIQGLFVGSVTGFVGAGGGFLIIPGLVLFARLEMKRAVGTSLLIVSMNSLLGFSSDLLGQVQVDWIFLISFTSLGIIGVLIGSQLSHKISNEKLKPLFGWFVLFAGITIILKEIF